MRRGLWVALSMFVGFAGAAQAAPRVVMISIDGLRPEVYLDPASQGLQMPNLVALRDEGARADRMIPVFPSVTYPAHTSLVTGTRPAEHGIVTNFVNGQEWYLDASDIQSPTLWQVAEAAGKTTAIVTWPASYGAKVDFLIPENLAFGEADVRKLVRDGSTPGLFDALERKCGRIEIPSFDAVDAGDRLDRVTTCFAAEILRTRKPDLLLLHYLDADHRQHFAGVHSADARHAFEQIDGFVGELRQAVREAGVDQETVFVIVGDHGFVPVHTHLNVHAVLLAAGHAKLEAGKIVLLPDLRVSALGGSAAIYLREGADPELALRLERDLRAELARRHEGLVELIPRSELDSMGAFPGAAFAPRNGNGLHRRRTGHSPRARASDRPPDRRRADPCGPDGAPARAGRGPAHPGSLRDEGHGIGKRPGAVAWNDGAGFARASATGG